MIKDRRIGENVVQDSWWRVQKGWRDIVWLDVCFEKSFKENFNLPVAERSPKIIEDSRLEGSKVPAGVN